MRTPPGVLCLVLLSLTAGCGGDDDAFDLSGKLSPVPNEGKDDGLGQPALRVDADVHDTEVWKVRNRWEDTDTPEARLAGLAWAASSGLSWDQKYAAWVGGMKKIPGSDDPKDVTYELVTPFGKSLPSPALECAETAMFLRATFAAWYGLPFFMEARDGGTRVFFGHFGVRTADGRWKNSPLFPQYSDHGSSWKPGQTWPVDGKLAKIHLAGGAWDRQTAIGPDAGVGAYLDAIHLNKRAGYFTAYLLDYFFSGNLADTANTYNLRPRAIREGDVVLHRSNRNGIGHTLVVKHVEPYNGDQILVQLIAGSMPRIQGDWKDETQSREEITVDSAGGVGSSDDKPVVPVWQLGGGLKRWRVARAVAGAWANSYMPSDQPSFIASTDGPKLSSRPKDFEAYIGEIPVEQRRDAYLKMIADAREALGKNPSSCESRTDRERAFRKLVLLAPKLGTSEGQINFEQRTLADAVFRTLSYPTSKTCCWDHSSPSMYRIVMDYAAEEMASARADLTCRAPTVFAASSQVPAGYDGPIDGYQLWRAWAGRKNRSAEWVDSDGKPAMWQKDEPCLGEASKDDASSGSDFDYCDSLSPPLPPPDLSGPDDLGVTADGGSSSEP
jgi:hypothetical protein